MASKSNSKFAQFYLRQPGKSIQVGYQRGDQMMKSAGAPTPPADGAIGIEMNQLISLPRRYAVLLASALYMNMLAVWCCCLCACPGQVSQKKAMIGYKGMFDLPAAAVSSPLHRCSPSLGVFNYSHTALDGGVFFSCA
jgi:hypothetical protein